MRLTPLVIAAAAVTLPLAPVVAQLRSSRPPPQLTNLPRLLVANPFSFSGQDSSPAVRTGTGMRDKITDVSDRWYKAITREQMNEALQQYAYPVDAVLPPVVARQLATSLNARAMVISTLLKGEGGRYTVEARLAGLTDNAGHIIRVTQLPNQSFEEFGQRVGDSLNPAFKALPDARNCENLRGTNVAKATEAALKALKTLPNDGLAEWCLAQIAIKEKAPPDSVIAHLKASTLGDRLSLDTWTALAVQYQAKGDSAKTIETFQELLRVAPTNEALRKEAFGLFQRYGRPDAAEDVADEGLKLDPANADFWDLKFGACIAQGKPEKNKCAIEALENVYALDSTKADTTFFIKMTFAASQPIGNATVMVDSTYKVVRDSSGTPVRRDTTVKVSRDVVVLDSAKFLKWARMGANKYPNNATLLGPLSQIYAMVGPVDSSVAVTKRLMAADSSDVTPVLRIVKALTDANRLSDALSLEGYVERLGDDEAKTTYANLVARKALSMLQTDLPNALAGARSAAKIAPKGTPVSALANYVLGIAAVVSASGLDAQAVSGKSCDIVKQMQALIDEAGPALDLGKSISPDAVAKYQAGVTGYGPRLAQMTKAYCK
jgi:tetratricopeptide (TPR) repeat protein